MRLSLILIALLGSVSAVQSATVVGQAIPSPDHPAVALFTFAILAFRALRSDG